MTYYFKKQKLFFHLGFIISLLLFFPIYNVLAVEFQPSAPYYATFFYPWFQNQKTDNSWGIWNSIGHSAPQNWFSNYLPDVNTSAFDPPNELYSSNDDTTIYWQLRKMAEAKQEVAISSWWGQGHRTDTAFRHIITDVMNRADNPYPNLRWAIYYEAESQGNPTVTSIANDLNYIKTNYANQPAYLRVGGKPVVFVYADATDGADMASRWAQARSQTGFYIVLKVYTGYKTDPNQPDSWHQYAPAARSDNQASYSYAVSPGFWKDGEVVRLPRNLTEFRSAVSAMVASSATWKLTETWNEWGEGSSVEPGDQVIQTTTGNATLDPNGVLFKNAYVDALNQLLPSLESGTVVPPTTDPILVGAGDIGWVPPTSPQKDMETAQLILNLINAGADAHVFTAGDNVNEAYAPYSYYTDYFDKSWGRFKSYIRPATGNHDYAPYLDGTTSYGNGYFDYYNGVGNFTGPAGDRDKGYYSYNLGSWHIVVLNSNCTRGDACGTGTTQQKWDRQMAWLHADLETNKDKVCTAAYWHHPLFSSGQHGNQTFMQPFWQTLYDYDVDVVMNGHSHDYERFALQNPGGVADPKGIREFVVGTGGRINTQTWVVQPNSQVRGDGANGANGVLKLTLHSTSYDWQFIPIAGNFTDSGTSNCVTPTSIPIDDTQPPIAPTNLTAVAPNANQVNLSWTASTDNVGIAGYKIFRGGTQISTSSATSYSDITVQPNTTYSYYVVAQDTAGNSSTPSNTVTITTPSATTTQTLTFNPTGDAYIQADLPTSNFGSNTNLEVDNSPIQNILLKFAVSGIGSGHVTSAKLRLYNTNLSAKGGDFYRVTDTSWNEGTVTWNNAPAANATLLASLGSVAQNNWYEVDVTPAILGDGTVSFKVTSTSTDGAWYSSKEGAFPPQLVITVAPSASFSVNLTANPSSGTVPLTTTLSADVSGTVLGTISYSFWWNCTNTSINVGTAEVACGVLPAPSAGSCSSNTNGYKCNSVNTDPQTVSYTYTTSGTYTAKVIAERGTALPAEARTATISVNNPSDTTSPIISNISTSNITQTSAVIAWQTNEPATSQIEYGLTTSYGSQTTLDSNLTTSHSQTLSTLSPGALYNFRVISKDGSGNQSVSINYTFTTTSPPQTDTTPPAKITNLTASNIIETSVDLSWVAPGDDGNQGIAYQYDIRYSTSTIAESNWNLATQVSGEPIPQINGISQSFTLVGLSPSTTYYFSIKASDEVPNWSEISNVVSTTTLTPPTKTLSVSLAANPSSGTAPLNRVDLTATVSGTTQGNINYTFYCNRSDTGTNITSGYAKKMDNTSQNPYTVNNVCSYTSPGQYNPKVIVERGAIVAEVRINLFVTETPTNPPPGGGGGGSHIPPTTDTIPPQPVTDFQAQPGDSQILLSWQNPADSDFVGVRVLKKTSSYPVSPTDGTLVYDGKKNSSVDTKLNNAQTYYYTIFAYDKVPNYSQGVSAQTIPKVGTISIAVNLPGTKKPISGIPNNYKFTQPLYLGKKNTDVTYLQIFLKNQGTDIYLQGLVTGYFGPLTKGAVIKFQVKYGIISTTSSPAAGLVGPKTRAKINGILGK